MSKKYRPLEYREVVTGLKALGFEMRPSKTGGSHEQWVKDVRHNGQTHRYKVTVDRHHAPFHRDLLKSMIRQAGVKREVFYRACEVAL